MPETSLPLELLRQFADAQACAIAIKDRDHRYLVVNELFAAALELDVDEMLGRNDLEIGVAPSLVHGDRTQDVTGLWALEDQVLAGELGVATRRVSVGEGAGAGHAAMPESHCEYRFPLREENGDIVAILVRLETSRFVEASGQVDELRRTLQENISTAEVQLSVLNELMERLMGFQALAPLLQDIAEVMINHTAARNALILLVEETGDYITVVASAGSHTEENMGQRRGRGAGFAGVAWETGQTQYLENSDCNELTSGYWPARTQLLAVPLHSGADVIGVAVLGTPHSEVEFKSSRGLANNLARLAGLAISNAQAEEQTRLELERTRALSDISRQLASADGGGELLGTITRTLMSAMNIDRTTSYRVLPSDILASDCCWIRDGDDVVPGELLPAHLTAGSISAWCFSNDAFASIARGGIDPRESRAMQKERVRLKIGGTLCMPVHAGQKIVGVLNVSRSFTKRDFDENEINLFCSIVDQVSSAEHGRHLSAALHHQAFHDSLTDLPNRRRFEQEVAMRLERGSDASASGLDDTGADTARGVNPSAVNPLAVIFLDLDGFKAVNDSRGHAMGDQLLRLVGQRLLNVLHRDDMLARIGGDEFAVVIDDGTDQSLGESVAQRLRDVLATPFSIDDCSIRIGTSVGVSASPADGDNVDALLRSADDAMYQAKSSGKNQVVCFDRDMHEAARQRVELESELREALEKRQFILYYQPQVDSLTQRVTSIEALVRWQHPTRGLVPPGVFIPLAEEIGLIDRIGGWVIEAAIMQLAEWRRTGARTYRIGVNVAASQFMLENFASDVLESLQRHEVPATLLEVELTESMVMSDISTVVDKLELLRDAGIRVALDDFGTGYSSLSYLQDLPLDVLKIDRSFVDRLETERARHSLVNTIMLLARGLELETVAEGVETDVQLQKIHELGCTRVQGYFFARPCDVSELQASVDAIEGKTGNTKLRAIA